MLWKRILFCHLLQRSSAAKKSRIKRRRDRNKLISKELGIGCGESEILLTKRKRENSIVESNNNEVRKRRKIAGNNGGFDGNSEIDWISELPESIIHHIFSFLRCSKDVARTTVLSKNWRRVFNSYHSFDFDQRWFRVRGGKGKHNRIKARELQKRRFRSYVDKSVATRLDPLVTVDKFRLYADNVDRTLVFSIIRWIRAAMIKNVKELDVQVYRDGMFMLPYDVFASKSLISLKLSGFILYDFAAIKMCNLRELSIKNTRVLSAYIMKKFEDSCPLLEDLRLVCCPEISHLTISSLAKLRRVEVQDCAVLTRIEIAASNLESFWYHEEHQQQCKIDLKGSENLRNLTLKDSMMTGSAFEDCISKFPLLEKLVLHECTSLEKLKIFSVTLKSLALIGCARLHEANINAPNLYSLEYSGNMMPFHSMNTSRLCEVKFSSDLVAKKPAKKPLWISDYQKLFGNLDACKGFKLIIYSKQKMEIFEGPTQAQLDRNHFDNSNFHKLHLTASSATVLKTVHNWLRECHGKSLALVSSNSELIKLIDAMIMDREHPSCCSFYSNKCWRHYIADVKFSTLKTVCKTCYGFTWRSRKKSSCTTDRTEFALPILLRKNCSSS